MPKPCTAYAFILILLAASSSMPAIASEDITELTWDDLWVEEGLLMEDFGGWTFKSRGSLPSNFFQPPESYLTTEYNGQHVKLDGFMLPLDMDRMGVSTFLLVPYVGACVHVPPPPPNQLVLVRSQKPYQSDNMFAPVSVTGVFHTEMISTDLADVGYTLEANKIDVFDDW